LSIERTERRALQPQSLTNRIRLAILERREARERAQAIAAGPSIKERQQALIHFYEEYETLVGILCDSAQYGPTAKLESAYQAQREWMLANYRDIGRYALAYLKFEIEDGGDAFESLFCAPDLHSFLQSDDGNMISRIMRTREALNLYGDHLRRLAAAA
jgi:hypothetical protein